MPSLPTTYRYLTSLREFDLVEEHAGPCIHVLRLSVWSNADIPSGRLLEVSQRFLRESTGRTVDIAFPIAVALGSVVAIVYAAIGGFRAVVLTETIQFALLLLGLVVTMVGAIMLSGGWDVISRVAAEQRDPGYFNLFSGFWPNLTYIVSFGLAFIIDGAAWQRIQAARSPGRARRTSVSAMI